MASRVLFVDDDTNILEGYKRSLRGQFQMETAPDGAQGLEVLEKNGPFEVVVSDLRMPGMDGIQFLSQVREKAPDTARIMLTGFAEVQTAIDAVNQGHIFRFLTKPCPVEQLLGVLTQGVDHYRLVTSEKELLEKTLQGVIKLLTDLLSLINPEAFGRASRLRRYAFQMAAHLGMEETWKMESAALLSQMGCLILPEETLCKVYRGEELSPEEAHHYQTHNQVAARLLANIPRLEEIAEIVIYQEKHFDGSGLPRNAVAGEAIPLGGRILKVVLDFDLLETRGALKAKALGDLKKRAGYYDPQVLAALEETLGDEARFVVRQVKVQDLRSHMIFGEDVFSLKGRLLISRGQEASGVLAERLRNFAAQAGVREPIKVFVPLQLEGLVEDES